MKPYKSFSILLLILSLFAGTLFGQSKKGSLKVEISGFENNKGNCRVHIFDQKNKEHYPSESAKALIEKTVKIKNKKVTITIQDLKYGVYAVSVHHDENKDGKIETSWIGHPTEALGASRDAKGSFGPPSFDDAKFKINKPKSAININIKHL